MKHNLLLHGSTRIAIKKSPLEHLNAVNGEPYVGTHSAVVVEI